MQRSKLANWIFFFLVITFFFGGAREDVSVDFVRIARYTIFGLIIFFGAITYFTYSSSINSRTIKEFNEICWPVLIFAIICFASVFQFQSQWLLITAKSSEIVFDYLVFLMIAVMVRDHRKVWRSFLLCGAIIIVLSIIESIYFNGFKLFDSKYRLECIYPYIGTGPITLFAVILLTYSIIFPYRDRKIQIVLKCLCIIAIILCKSRGGIISFGVTMFLVSLIEPKIFSELKKYVIIIIIFFALFQNKIYDIMILRGDNANNLNSLGGRTYIWDVAMEYVNSNLLFGNGYYASIRLYMPQHFKGWLTRFSTLDNPWLDILMGVGLIGLSVYVVFFVILLIRLRNLYLSARREKNLNRLNELSFLIFVFIFNLMWSASGNFVHLHGFSLVSIYLIVISIVKYSLEDSKVVRKRIEHI